MLDPLGEAADPRRYVPIASSERALAALAAGLDAGRTPLLLAGPSGLGKTLLLRMLAEAAERCGRRVVLSPFLHLPPEDAPRWLLHLMADAQAGACDEERLLAALRDDRRRTLLLVDEAHAAPLASIGWLGELARAARTHVAVVAAASTTPALASRADALDPELTVTLSEHLPIAEMHALYEAILVRSPSLRRALDARGEEAVLRASAGNPALLKTELFRRMERDAREGAVACASRREASLTGAPPAARQRWRRPRIETAPVAPPRAEPSHLAPSRPEPPALALPLAAIPIAVARARGAPPAPACSQGVPRPEFLRHASRGHAIFLRRGAGGRRALADEAPLRAAEPRRALQLELPRGGSTPGASSRRAAPVARLATAWRTPRRALSRGRLTGALALLGLGFAFGAPLHSSLGGDAASRPAALVPHAGPPTQPPAPVAAPRRSFVSVQVNAHPWARIRVDGRDIGATPLRFPLPPGTYDFEAALPDGRTLRRRVEVGPAQRFVAFP